MTDRVVPRLAATVILVREAPAGAEVLLVRRHSGIAFMGGVWVFPGGRQDPADLSPAAVAAVPAEDRPGCGARWVSPGSTTTAAQSLAMWVTACRETFEETGILLARRGTDPVPAALTERLAAGAVGDRATAFAGLLEREGLSVPGALLLPWLRWITPGVKRTRFDTCFFVARVPDGQRCVLNGEATEHTWARPLAAIEAWERGELGLVTPTAMTLRDLALSLERHGTIGRLLEREGGRDLPPIMPKARDDETRRVILLPWDPEYAAAPGEGSPLPAAPGALAEAPSRMSFPAGAQPGVPPLRPA